MQNVQIREWQHILKETILFLELSRNFFPNNGLPRLLEVQILDNNTAEPTGDSASIQTYTQRLSGTMETGWTGTIVVECLLYIRHVLEQ